MKSIVNNSVLTSYTPLEIGHIKLKYPILQGGMGVGVSLSKLAGAVSKCGGLGVISSAQIGFKDPLFKKETLKTNLDALEFHIKEAKKISDNGAIGVNIMAVTENYDEYVKRAISSGVDIIITGAGIANSLPELVKGTKTKFAPIFSSLKATKIVLKMWDKKSSTTPDAIVVEGPKAGGHLGFKNDQLDDIEALNYDDEITQIIEHVKIYEEKYNKKIPVIFGGGITTSDDVKHYMDLGCSGVQVATRFVTTFECDAHEAFKQAYLQSTEEDVTIIKSPVGLPGRAIKNNFVTGEKQVIKHCYNCISTCDPKTTEYCITDALIKAVNGDIENGLVFAGANVYKTDKICTVDEVITDLFKV